MEDALVVLLGCGVVMLILGVFSLTGRLRRNWFAGIRVGAVMASDAAWRAGHRAAAPLMIATGGLGLLLAGILGFVHGIGPRSIADRLDPSWVLIGYVVALLAGSIAFTVVALRAARAELEAEARAKRRRR